MKPIHTADHVVDAFKEFMIQQKNILSEKINNASKLSLNENLSILGELDMLDKFINFSQEVVLNIFESKKKV